MNYRSPIIIVPGEPNSIFFEIFFKSLKKLNIKSPIILITTKDLILKQTKKFKYKKKINIIDIENIKYKRLNNSYLNIVNINYKNLNSQKKILSKSNKYILNCFETAFYIIKKYKFKKFINGPVNKKKFLNKNYLGMTEYISSKFRLKKNAMLIYNEKLSVCPLTTHLPLKYISKKINKVSIIEKVKLIDDFYKLKIKKKPKIAILGLNPHCESIDKFNEDEKIIKPVVNILKKKKFQVSGPYSADTIFLKQNRTKFNAILGMYHDQVLTPIKTLFEYDAINITLGLPFIRISPDHGPNENMIGKNISNPLSLIKAISFLDKN